MCVQVLKFGMGKRMGPMDLMHLNQKTESGGLLLRTSESTTQDDQMYYHATEMPTEMVGGELHEVYSLHQRF